ncbi:hypothetical protein FGG08_002079 [Glutinoglossum americanum]|uniref:Uncharacterized protein n=1 Tax=Glutinoglossum americanum TaxID=1670608 RepID=A0A9P8IFU2_9PEZI|nr:hypothetical protein FGG08_002079 [Glutinoglossum americanum]
MELEERDEAGNLTTTYIESLSKGGRRIDVVKFNQAFQDSLQAFSSSIAGLLSSRAVLQGVGVGDATASPTAALLLTVIQESMGRLATILFAHKLGNSLVAECKRYRLLADIFNDAAIIIDCLSPVFPKPVRVVLLSVSSVSRAICGVAAGSSKTSLSAHFAKWGNLGELNAVELWFPLVANRAAIFVCITNQHDIQKDASQETIISLMGMLVGSVVVSNVSSTLATWSSLILLLSIHLFANYKAVRAVRMLTLNRQRASIVFSTLIEQGEVLTPKDASEQERVFEWDGVLRWGASELTGHALIGVRLQLLLASIAGSFGVTGSIQNPIVDLTDLAEIFSKENFLLWVDTRERRALIALKEGCSTTSQLKAWTLALMVTRKLKQQEPPLSDPQGVLQLLQETLDQANRTFDGFLRQLTAAGWDVRSSALETRPGFRIKFPVG